MAESTFVVQVAETDDGGRRVWRDLAEVKVPARSKRRTIIEKALDATSGAQEEELCLRILDADTARPTFIGWMPQPAVLQIKGPDAEGVVDGPPDMG
jgi:hypothetical protein